MKSAFLLIIFVTALSIFTLGVLPQMGFTQHHQATQSMDLNIQKRDLDTARCAYDGMLMMKSMMVSLKQDNETLYFCNEEQKKAFQKNPKAYLKKVSIGKIHAFLNILNIKEYSRMMGIKKMENQNDTHWFSAYLADDPQLKISGITVGIISPDGKASYQELKFDNMMKTYTGNFSLPEGKKYKIKLLLETPEIEVP